LVIVGARHASPLPFRTGKSPCASGCPSPHALDRRRDTEAKNNQGGFGTRPYNDPTIRNWQFAIRRLSPFTIRHSLFAIRNLFPFAIRRFPLLAARYSLLPVLFHSPFAIRHSLFSFTARRSPLAARRLSLFAIRPILGRRFFRLAATAPACLSDSLRRFAVVAASEVSGALVLHRARAAVLAQVSI
jgi:hypothetical protein